MASANIILSYDNAWLIANNIQRSLYCALVLSDTSIVIAHNYYFHFLNLRKINCQYFLSNCVCFVHYFLSELSHEVHFFIAACTLLAIFQHHKGQMPHPRVKLNPPWLRMKLGAPASNTFSAICTLSNGNFIAS